jgi:hypothetical protein
VRTGQIGHVAEIVRLCRTISDDGVNFRADFAQGCRSLEEVVYRKRQHACQAKSPSTTSAISEGLRHTGGGLVPCTKL